MSGVLVGRRGLPVPRLPGMNRAGRMHTGDAKRTSRRRDLVATGTRGLRPDDSTTSVGVPCGIGNVSLSFHLPLYSTRGTENHNALVKFRGNGHFFLLSSARWYWISRYSSAERFGCELS